MQLLTLCLHSRYGVVQDFKGFLEVVCRADSAERGLYKRGSDRAHIYCAGKNSMSSPPLWT